MNLENLSSELNDQQLRAVQRVDGPLMVVAGAGSGKTRVITYRIAYMVREKMVAPESILAITFTNKAAREMKERVHRMMDSGKSAPWVSTFHSFCLRLLRQHVESLGFTNDFAVYDAQDQLSVVKQCMKTAGMSTESFPPKSLLNHISGFKNDFILPQDINLDSLSFGQKMKAAELYPLYQKTLRDNNALDFDDLLVMSVRLLQEVKHVLEYCHARFRYLLVDEFQDTNMAQYKLVRLLAGKSNNVCVVGDDDQSIYRWRGANIENIMNFEKDFENTLVIKLEENYRSTQNILKAANAVVKENVQRKDKNLWTKNGLGDPIIYYRADSELDEARAVCEQMVQWNRDHGYSFDDMAVLYRTNAQSRVMEDQLRQLSIPYQVIGGLRFYERKEIKDVLAYMRATINPADSVSLKRILNVPTRGIGKTSVDKIENFCASQNISFFQGLRMAEEKKVVGSGPGKKISQFVSMMDGLESVCSNNSPIDFIKEIVERTGYLAMLEKDGSVESRSRLENLNELYSALEEFSENEDGTLKDFLDRAALAADIDSMDDSRGTLPLMTLHTCKGLEFDAVSIIGMENGLLPHASSMSDVEEFEEERRLCYVGFTRARKHLLLSNARRRRIYGSNFNYLPSDFLGSIPAEILVKEMSASIDSYSQPQSYGYKDSPAASLPPGRSTREDDDYAVGTKVLHPKFGSGVVVNKEGKEEDLRVVIFFKKAGKKKLAVNHANLILL